MTHQSCVAVVRCFALFEMAKKLLIGRSQPVIVQAGDVVVQALVGNFLLGAVLLDGLIVASEGLDQRALFLQQRLELIHALLHDSVALAHGECKVAFTILVRLLKNLIQRVHRCLRKHWPGSGSWSAFEAEQLVCDPVAVDLITAVSNGLFDLVNTLAVHFRQFAQTLFNGLQLLCLLAEADR